MGLIYSTVFFFFIFLSLPHGRILPLQQVLEQDLQFQPHQPDRPDPKPAIRDPAPEHVPEKCGPQDSHRHGPHLSQNLRQCLF